ncbi:hypothetical protein SAMN04487771_100741 [[Clostridium] aminophilum]|uniref:Uncharacterized protein n=1 Tax=[Clostridium] aminophilum TaxID=1526 RepID=A0A1I0CGA8_9FIRM|nr:hypothetical protein SAMN04487771_100741 [[Clostridium] aminophilum]
MKRFRLLALLLSFVFLFSNLASVCAFAANDAVIDAVERDESGNIALTGLSLTDVEEPREGKALDDRAKITTDQGVSWEIPVLWIDPAGNPVENFSEETTCFPIFVVYIPTGYSIKTSASDGSFAIYLPEFVKNLYGDRDGSLFVSDPALGFLCITPVPLKFDLSTRFSNQAPDSFAVPLNEKKDSTDQQYPEDSDDDSSDSQDPHRDRVEPDDPNKDPADELPYLVRIHCDKSAIETYDAEFLNEFVTLLRYTIIPQAAKLLEESFPKSFGSATPDKEIGTQLGLNIYYNTTDFSGREEDWSGGSAFLDGKNSSSTATYMYTFLVNTGAIFITDSGGVENIIQQDDNGKWTLVEGGRKALENIILHELFHAYMYDYNHTGMSTSAKTGDLFPFWFTEGTASSVQNVFQSRVTFFRYLQVDNVRDTWAYKMDYDTEHVLSRYLDTVLHGPTQDYTICNDIEQTLNEDLASANYVSGYLASVYLAGLAGVKYCDYTSEDLHDTQNNIYNMEVIRAGMEEILYQLHNNKPLDTIISEISDGAYNDTDDFTKRFVKGIQDEHGVYQGDQSSLQFVADYLNFLEDSTTMQPNGSILRQEQGYVSPLTDEVVKSTFFNVVDSRTYVPSTADYYTALDTAGKSTTTGLGSNSTENGTAMAASIMHQYPEINSVSLKAGNEMSDDAAVDSEVPSDDAVNDSKETQSNDGFDNNTNNTDSPNSDGTQDSTDAKDITDTSSEDAIPSDSSSENSSELQEIASMPEDTSTTTGPEEEPDDKNRKESTPESDPEIPADRDIAAENSQDKTGDPADDATQEDA